MTRESYVTFLGAFMDPKAHQGVYLKKLLRVLVQQVFATARDILVSFVIFHSALTMPFTREREEGRSARAECRDELGRIWRDQQAAALSRTWSMWVDEFFFACRM